jgi:ComF family protein
VEFEDLEPKERWICESCLKKVPIRRIQACPACEEYSEGGKTHIRCRRKTSLDGLWVSSEYDSKLVSDAIKKLKFSFVRDISFSLSKIIERSVLEAEEFTEFHDIFLDNFSWTEDEDKYIDEEKNRRTETVLVPVPLHKKRQNWRGFNQAELISRNVSERFNISLVKDTVARVKNTQPQTKVDTVLRRKENISGAFLCQDPALLKNKNVIILDDVSTTLATIDECAGVIRRSGAKSVWGLVVARR